MIRTFQVLYPFEMYTESGEVIKVKRNSTITIDEGKCHLEGAKEDCDVDLMDITDRLRESFC